MQMNTRYSDQWGQARIMPCPTAIARAPINRAWPLLCFYDMNRRTFFAVLLVFAALIVPAHASERVLYEKASAYSTIIVTEDEAGLRTLRFEKGGARQSVVKPGDPEYLALPYAPVMLAGLALSEDPRRILIVGLGGGTLPMLIRKPYPGATVP